MAALTMGLNDLIIVLTAGSFIFSDQVLINLRNILFINLTIRISKINLKIPNIASLIPKTADSIGNILQAVYVLIAIPSGFIVSSKTLSI